MNRSEELNLFLEKTDEFISGKYILADIKIINMLKAIANSNTILALLKSCTIDFDYQDAKSKYLKKSALKGEDKGEFVPPASTKEFLAFVFCLIMDIDSKKIVFTDFLNKYFYEDGSCFSAFNAFIVAMIIPFRNSVKSLVESVIAGEVEDPIESLTRMEEKIAREKMEEKLKQDKLKELSQKKCGESIIKLKKLLALARANIENHNFKHSAEKNETLLIVTTLESSIDMLDKDALSYSFIAFKFMCKAHPMLFYGILRKAENCLKDIKDGI